VYQVYFDMRNEDEIILGIYIVGRLFLNENKHDFSAHNFQR